MQPGQRVNTLARFHEGLRLVAYHHEGDVWSLGRGHTRGVKQGDTCTEAQADAWFLEDLGVAADDVRREFPAGLTQGQFDALTDWAFEFGYPRLHGSTMARMIHQGKLQEAGRELLRWVYVNGKISSDLRARRAQEFLWFVEPQSVANNP